MLRRGCKGWRGLAKKLVAIGLAAISIVIGVVYPYLLLTLNREEALQLLLYTVAALSVLVGGLIGAVALVLLRGFGPSEESEDRS